jgi:hypothetical protein
MRKKNTKKNGRRRHLEDSQILGLVEKICSCDQELAEALLLLMAEIEDAAQSGEVMDVERLTIPIKQVAFSYVGDDAMSAQIALLRSEVPA